MDYFVFDKFERQASTTTGRHIFDFLGGRTKVAYKKGWERHARPENESVKPGFPTKNEHYLDWIATLNSVDNAGSDFRMAELGAGWAPWLVRAALAARQRPEIQRVQLLGIEADPTHYDWMQDHFQDNSLSAKDYDLIFGAASSEPGTLRFPVVENPDVDYGASLIETGGAVPHIEVRGYSISEIIDHFDGPIDFLHIDIQGAEYGLLPGGMKHLLRSVKLIMVGTHRSNDRHDALAAAFRDAGWTEEMNFARNTLCRTPVGEIQFGDGFLLFSNPNL